MSTERRLVGNIEKRGEGKYRLTVSAGTDANGKRIRHRKTVQAKTDTDAEKQLALFIARLEGGEYHRPEHLHFKTFAEKWIKEYAKPNLAPKTIFRYEEMLNSRVIPALGNFTLSQLRPLHVLEFLNSLRKDGVRLDGKPGGLSESTIRHHYRMLSSMFSTAEEWGLVNQNIVARLKPPKVERKKAASYNQEETAAMLKALDSEPLKYKAMIYLALASGLRLGELLGLEWSDIDFQGNTLDVQRASQSLPEQGTFTKTTKTEESQRLISMPASVMRILKEYRIEWLEHKMKIGDLWEGSERLWVQWNGKPMYTGTPSAWFPKFLKRHGLPHLNFHGLRHTSATLLISSGVDVRSVSGRLGHAQSSTTLNIYSHFLRSADEAAANIMDQILTQSN